MTIIVHDYHNNGNYTLGFNLDEIAATFTRTRLPHGIQTIPYLLVAKLIEKYKTDKTDLLSLLTAIIIHEAYEHSPIDSLPIEVRKLLADLTEDVISKLAE